MSVYTIQNINETTTNPQNVSTSYISQLSVTSLTGATTLRKGWVMEWEIGATDVPNSTDCPLVWDIGLISAAGTGNAPTIPIMDNDAAALLTYKANLTGEPTYTAGSSVWNMGLNQRASYRIQMRDEYHAPVIKAVTANGLGFRVKSPNYASKVNWRALVKE